MLYNTLNELHKFRVITCSSMAHIHKLIDWTAGAYIVHKNKVLLRKHDKYGVWCHVGGHVELDEDPVTAAIRECKEEVGLDVTIHDAGVQPEQLPEAVRYLPPPAHMNIHHVGGAVIELHQHIDLIYSNCCRTPRALL